jgi:hypothetical protein
MLCFSLIVKTESFGIRGREYSMVSLKISYFEKEYTSIMRYFGLRLVKNHLSAFQEVRAYQPNSSHNSE